MLAVSASAQLSMKSLINGSIYTMASTVFWYVKCIHYHLNNCNHEGLQSHVATQISETVPADYATSLNVVYFPQLGWFLL